ncbi:MAG: cytochrome c1 [Rhodospirillaceae bacterium]|nr:cytochrome c1 [Rhodospirillaceae bacterium]
MSKRNLIIAAALSVSFAFSLASGTAKASGAGAEPLPDYKWGFEGIFGSFDKAQLKRGARVYLDVCSSCHSIEMIYYRNLVDIGFSEDEAKDIASEYEVQDGPDDEGEMFMRPARLSDRFVKPFANEKAARASNGGAFPPDLSVITKARKGGANYIYGLMTGYEDDAPEGFEMSEGTHYNRYFPGHQIFMAQPLFDESVEYEDGTEATLDQHAKDISAFLAWSSNPELEERKSLGVKVILYLIILTAMFYALKRRIWNRICLDEYTHGPYVEKFEAEINKHKRPN